MQYLLPVLYVLSSTYVLHTQNKLAYMAIAVTTMHYTIIYKYKKN